MLEFHNQTNFYSGKVRDVYTIGQDKLVMVASNRISAFDVILPKPIPYKGQILNQTAKYFLEATKDIVPNWLLATPHPQVSIGIMCQTLPVEIVVRGYISGHLARTYASGARILCGVALPNGLKENSRLPTPIITPTTKAMEGHDEDISREEIIAQGLVEKSIYEAVEAIALKLFERGSKMAAEKGLILVDTKYEFGLKDGKIVLIDEIHTPDSSRYFYADGYEELLAKDMPQRQLSKEFVRQWLIENGFQGKEGQQVPEMTAEWTNEISQRYIELYEKITGQKFVQSNEEIQVETINKALESI